MTLVCLSATVANADQLAAWISEVRGATGVVIETHRPVELKNLFVVGDRFAERLHLLPTFVDGRPNPEAMKLDELIERPGSGRRAASLSRQQTRGERCALAGPGPAVASGGRSCIRPRRIEVVERLADEQLLPAIYFVFSRAGCDESVRQCLEDGLRLTTPEERQRIRAIVESYVDPLTDEDLSVLGYSSYVASLEAGMAAHHAGMVPPFREAVEACFAEALVKVVFATETLALGINMPATVSGDRGGDQVRRKRAPRAHAGRVHPAHRARGQAGDRRDRIRRCRCALPFHSFDDVARIAGGRPRALSSSFRPTYNLAVNLVRRHTREAAYGLVSSSFAQFLSDEDLAGELDAVLACSSEGAISTAGR